VARLRSPTVLFFEDIDLIAGTGRKVRPKVKNEFMQQLSGLESTNGVLAVGTTNTFSKIDDALKRSKRFGFHFYIGKPKISERSQLFKLFLKKYKRERIDYRSLADFSEGLTGADIKDIVYYAHEKALSVKMKINQELLLKSIEAKRKMNLNIKE